MKASSPDVIIVGAGPAGLGMALELREAGIRDTRILDAEGVGASFRNWPRETRLLTPSFPGDAYGCPDLNSVFPGHSPAPFCGTEHPSGKAYADWLEARAREADLRVHAPVRVESARPVDEGFELSTSDGGMTCRCLVWATGEFFFPRRPVFPGAEHAIHYADVGAWSDMEGDRVVVIGGAESGIDAACLLLARGKQVTVLDSGAAWLPEEGDPSDILSPRTRKRLRVAQRRGGLTLVPDSPVIRIEEYADGYGVFDTEGRFHGADVPPVLCCGFEGGAGQLHDLWEWDGSIARLTEHDESTRTPGLYLVGPEVRHPGEIFCFIYKFRTRFPRVARHIVARLQNPG